MDNKTGTLEALAVLLCFGLIALSGLFLWKVYQTPESTVQTLTKGEPGEILTFKDGKPAWVMPPLTSGIDTTTLYGLADSKFLRHDEEVANRLTDCLSRYIRDPSNTWGASVQACFAQMGIKRVWHDQEGGK
jgi:hypothetical protein